MVEREFHSDGRLSQGLHLFTLLGSKANEIVQEAAVQGRDLTVIETFDRAVSEMDWSKEDLLTVWVTLEGALRSVRRAGNLAPETKARRAARE